MHLYIVAHALAWSLGFGTAVATPSAENAVIEVRSPVRVLESDPWAGLRKEALIKARDSGSNVVFNETKVLDTSWNSATLYLEKKFNASTGKSGQGQLDGEASVQITCTTCYLKGSTTASLTIDGNWNITEEIHDYVLDIKEDITEFRHNVTDYVEDYITTSLEHLKSLDFDIDDYDLPPFNFSFNLPVPEMNNATLQVQLDGFELYVMLDTLLTANATYRLNLFTSSTPVGSASKDGKELLGIVVVLDLILIANADVDITSGFHISLDDEARIDIEMFSQKPSSMSFKGGHFEFLPVTVSGAGSLTAALRLGVRAGVAVEDDDFKIGTKSLSFGAGAEVDVYVYLAEFITDITGSTGSSSDCNFEVVEYYQFAVGGARGATIAVQHRTWGPDVSTTIPIYTTTLASVCAVSPTKALAARDDLVEMTFTPTYTFTGTSCLAHGLVECPVSSQTTTIFTVTTTLITSVPSTETAMPATVTSSVAKTIPFGTNANVLGPTSGPPESFEASGGLSQRNKTIIGVCVGLILPLILAGIGALLYMRYRKNKTQSVVQGKAPPAATEPYSPPVPGYTYSTTPMQQSYVPPGPSYAPSINPMQQSYTPPGPGYDYSTNSMQQSHVPPGSGYDYSTNPMQQSYMGAEAGKSGHFSGAHQ